MTPHGYHGDVTLPGKISNKNNGRWVKKPCAPEQDFSVWPFRSGRFGLAVSVTGHFGKTMNSCRNLTLMQSRAVWFKAHSLHHRTVGCQRSRNSTQSVLPSRFAIAASAFGKVFYWAF